VATRLAVTIDTPAPPLHAVDTASTPVSHPRGDAGSPALTLDRAIDALIVLALCVVVGRLLHAAVTAAGITVPGFLTAMLVAVVLTNIADVLRIPTATRAIDLFGELALELFLAMSLMSVQLWMLAALAGPIAVISAVQIVTTCAVCAGVLFAWLGRSYDAAVTVGGVIGYGLSSMPVAMATMDRVTARHGPSPRAVLTISLAGAIFVDVVNAMLIRAFMALPGLH
jgi:glutamate:Na+ symporter, ESS family